MLCDPRPRWAAGSKNGGVACGNKFLRNTPRKRQALPILAANLAARKVIYTRFACRNANCSAAAIVSFNLNLASVDRKAVSRAETSPARQRRLRSAAMPGARR